MDETEGLTKVTVNLPNHWATGSETMWARPLGEDRFEIQNVPFYAYGLNYLDVVRAVAPTPDQTPVVLERIETSGHQTLRVNFSDSLPDAARLDLLDQLETYQTSFEGVNAHYFALAIEPTGDLAAVRARLEAWEARGILDYETCEERIPGSFDDHPDDEG